MEFNNNNSRSSSTSATHNQNYGQPPTQVISIDLSRKSKQSQYNPQQQTQQRDQSKQNQQYQQDQKQQSYQGNQQSATSNTSSTLVTNSIILNQSTANTHNIIFFNNQSSSQIIQSQPTPTSQINIFTGKNTKQITNYDQQQQQQLELLEQQQQNHKLQTQQFQGNFNLQNQTKSHYENQQRKSSGRMDEQETPTNEFIDDEEDDIDEMSSSNYSYQTTGIAYSQHSKQLHNHNQFPGQYTDHRKMNNKIMQIEKTSNNLSTQYQVSSIQQVNQSQSLIQPNNSSITRKLPQNTQININQQQQKGNANQQLRLPMGSSEMNNAFSHNKNDNFGHGNNNKQIDNKLQNSQAMQDTHTPINMSTGRSRIEMIQSQVQSSKTSARKLEQSQFQEQPKFQGKNFFVPHQQQNQRDMDEMMYDQGEDYHNMTEQDLDGHDIQEEEDDDGYAEAQDQDIQDYHDEENQINSQQLQRDHNNDDDNYISCNEDNNDGDVEDDDLIQDSLKSVSPDEKPSQPNQIQNPNQFEYFSNSQNDSAIRPSYQLRSSSQTDVNQSHVSTLMGGNDLPFFNVQNCNNAVVERNERFLVLKMVPQPTAATGIKDQPTPLLKERNLQAHNNKVYRETVEDINSSDDSEKQIKQDQFFSYDNDQQQQQLQQDSLMSLSPNQEQYGKTQVMDHSLIEETRIDYNQIRSMKNQIVNQQQQDQSNKNSKSTQNPQQIAKEAKIYKQLKQQNYMDDENDYQQQNEEESFDDNSQEKSFSSYSRSTISDRFNKLQKLEKKDVIEENPTFTMTKENLNFILKQTQQHSHDDSLNNNNQNSDTLIKGINNSDQIIDVEQQMKLNDRRQSDSAVLIRNSQIQQNSQQLQLQLSSQSQMNKNIINYDPQSQQHSTQKVNKRSYDYTQKSQKVNSIEIEELKETFTDSMATNIRSDNFTQDQFDRKQKPLKQNNNNQQNNDEITSSNKDSKLLEEYKQLKLLMKQMEKNPKIQNSQQKQGRSKNNNLLVSKTTNQQQQQQQNDVSNNKSKIMLQGMSSRDQSQIKEGIQSKLENQKSQARSRKNLMSQQSLKDQQQQQHQQFHYQNNHSNQISSYLSEGAMEDQEQSYYYKKQGQQYNKMGLLSVQQSTKAKDMEGKALFKANKDQEQSSRIINKKQQQTHKSTQRQSPHTREKSQKQHNRQLSKGIKRNKIDQYQHHKLRNQKHVDDDEEESASDNSNQQNNRDLSSHSSPDAYQNQTYIKKQNHHDHHKNDQSIKHHKSTHKQRQQLHDSNDQYQSKTNQKNPMKSIQLNIDKSRLAPTGHKHKNYQDIDSDEYNSHQSYEDENFSPSRRKESRCEDDYEQSFDARQNHSEDNAEDQESSEYSENDSQSQNDDEEDSEYDQEQNSSDVNSNDDSDYESESNSSPDMHNQSRRHQNQKKTSKQQESKVRKITKTVKQGDRKFKININMHGEKVDKKGKNKQRNEHEILLFKQRQMLQQQQMMLQMAQYPQQQMLLQQQLALQQQLLLQQHQNSVIPQQNTFINPTNIQSTVNLGGMQSPQGHLDVTSPSTFQNHAQKQNTSNYNPNNNMSVFSNNKQVTQIDDQRFKAAQMKRENSSTSLNNNLRTDRFNQNNVSQLNQQNQFRQLQQKTQDQTLGQNLSPNRERLFSKEDYNRGGNYQYNQNQDYRAMYEQKSISQIRSPHREEDYNNSFMGGGVGRIGGQQQQQQEDDQRFQNQQHSEYSNNKNNNNNYLNQIKNRMRKGHNEQNSINHEDYDNFMNIGRQNQQQIDSRNRNQKILQNNSSPVQNQQNLSRDEDKSFRNYDYQNNNRNDRLNPTFSNKEQYELRQRGGDIQEYKPKQHNERLNYTRFEDAKDYARNNFQENDEDFQGNLGSFNGNVLTQRHARTSSYVPPPESMRQGQDNYDYAQKSTFGRGKNDQNLNKHDKDQKISRHQNNQNNDNSGNATPMQRYENEEGDFDHVFNQQPPNFSKHNTGDFPGRSQQVLSNIPTKLRDTKVQDTKEHDKNNQEKWQPRKKPQNFIDDDDYFNRDRSRSANERDQSMDEGVSVANLRQSKQLSPKAEFNVISKTKYDQKKISKKNKDEDLQDDQNFVQARPSLNKQQSMKTESTNKKAQMIIIGFDDDEKQDAKADIFKNKPKLKQREKGDIQQQQHQDFQLRSKSSKPLTSNANKQQTNDSSQNQPQQRRVPFQRQKLQQQQQDTQPQKSKVGIVSEVSPPTAQSTNFYQDNHNGDKQTPNNQLIQLKNLNQSPLKKAVKNIQDKDSIKSNITKRGGEMVSVDLAQDEDIDPKHNKSIAIEIFDKNHIKSGASQQQEKSLADMFLAKKREALHSRQDAKISVKPPLDQDSHMHSYNNEKSQDRPIAGAAKQQEKSKKELAELRKQMMKNRVKSGRDNFSQNPQGPTASNPNGQIDPNMENKNKKAAANEELMMRLAMGKKVQVDKKEMKKLTSKNFQNLPEIKKKKEEEQKRQMQAERKAAAALYMKEFAEKRRQQILKKKKSGNNIIEDGEQ